VVATDRTLHHLQQLDAGHFAGEAAALLPGETFEKRSDIRVGNKTLQLIHPGRGHTDGDLVVLFVEDQTLHTGDLFFNRHYPNIDLEAGGSVAAWGDTLDVVLGLPARQIIPGHGDLSDKQGLVQFQGFIRQLAALGTYAASINGSLVDTQVNGELTEDAGYQVISFGPFMSLDREFVIRRAWEEATGDFQLYPGY
jgi:cyclase